MDDNLGLLVFTLSLIISQIPKIFRPQSQTFNFDYSPKPERILNEADPLNKSLERDLEPKKSSKRNFDSLREEKKERKADGGKVAEIIRRIEQPVSDSPEDDSKERKFVKKKLRYETKFDETKQVYKSGSRDDSNAV